jgi:hypothetical protein
MMPKRSSTRRPRKNGKSRAIAIKNTLAVSGAITARGDVNFPKTDLILKPPGMLFRATPPRNWSSQTHWVRATVTNVFSAAANVVSTGVIDMSLAATANQTAISSMFDQYAIHSVVHSFALQNLSSPTDRPGILSTAVTFDLDDYTSIPTLPEIRAYATALTTVLEYGKSHERYVEPCVGVLTNGSSSPVVQRTWCDSGDSSTLHYGLVYAVDSPSLAISILVTSSYLIACRNSK